MKAVCHAAACSPTGRAHTLPPFRTAAVSVPQLSQRCTQCIRPPRDSAAPRTRKRAADGVLRNRPPDFASSPRAHRAFINRSVARSSVFSRRATSPEERSCPPTAVKRSSSQAVSSARLCMKAEANSMIGAGESALPADASDVLIPWPSSVLSRARTPLRRADPVPAPIAYATPLNSFTASSMATMFGSGVLAWTQ